MDNTNNHQINITLLNCGISAENNLIDTENRLLGAEIEQERGDILHYKEILV